MSAPSAAPNGTGRLGRAADALRLVLVLIALVAVFGLATDRFFSLRTFQVIANQLPVLLTVSIGMTYVLLVGGIDLSVGSALALGAGTLGILLSQKICGLPLAILACLAVGLGIGAVNALVSIRWRLPSFIVTLGMLEVARGGAYLVTGSRTQYVGAAIEAVQDVSVLGLSLPFLLALLLVVAGQALLTRTVFGRYVVAVGANEEAVRLSGIDTRRIKLMVFAGSGLLAGLAGVLHTARLAAADPNAGAGLELQAIAAAVVGGTSLRGGRGGVVGTLLGVLVMSVLETGLAQVGAQEPVKRLVTGAVIVVAVIFDNRRHRKTGGSREDVK